MTKEERELRKYLFGPEHPMNAQLLKSMITAMRRAIIEECARVAENAAIPVSTPFGKDQKIIAAAIRGGK